MTTRRTLARPASLSGVSLFSARDARCTILPSREGRGIVFRRADLPGSPDIPGAIASLSTAPIHPAFAKLPPRNTVLGSPPALAATTEHVLSALMGLGVTDATIELDAPELPIFDGSAEPFVRAIMGAGLADVDDEIPPIVAREPVTVRHEHALITASPRSSPGCSFTYILDYGPGAPIPPQRASWAGDPDAYVRGVAAARTFCTDTEARMLSAAGLFTHLSPREMLVIGPQGPIENTLRFPDEPARHKLLDLIGDLALVGRPIQADIVADRSGHALNHAMARALAALR